MEREHILNSAELRGDFDDIVITLLTHPEQHPELPEAVLQTLYDMTCERLVLQAKIAKTLIDAGMFNEETSRHFRELLIDILTPIACSDG